MIHASVFSGIGGPEVAAAMLGWENAFHCDINPFGVAVLNYWFPKAKSYGDVKKQSFKNWGGRIDVLTGGFPCQPFSNAGKRGGASDYRYLWPEMLRVIQEVRPTWFVGENVDGLTTMVEPGTVTEMGCETSLFGEGDGLYRYQSRDTFTIERICRDLESARYTVQPFIIPACAVGAPHRRDRVFLVAYNTDCGDGCTKPGDADSQKESQGIQERHDIRKSGESGFVRPEVCKVAENSLRSGCVFGQEKEQGNIGNERHTCAGDSERICGEARTDSSYTNDSGVESMRQFRENEVCEPCTSADSNGKGRQSRNQHLQSELANGTIPVSNGRVRSSANTESESAARCKSEQRKIGSSQKRKSGGSGSLDNCGTFESDKGLLPENRWANFPTVSPVHAGNDGLPFDISDLSISFPKWRNGAIEACGNAIVVQVMYEIFRAIQEVDSNGKGKI